MTDFITQKLVNEKIQEKIHETKRTSSGKYYTNYYQNKLNSDLNDAYIGQHTLVFLDKDIDFRRLYFFTYDLNELKNILTNIQYEKLVIDYISKGKDVDVHSTITGTHFNQIAIYKRFVNDDLPHYHYKGKNLYATENDSDELYDRLFKDFDKYLDHLPKRETLVDLIKLSHVYVTKQKDKIEGYLIYQIQNKRMFINYWYNQSNPIGALSLLINLYSDMFKKNIRFGYGWADSRKENVIKTHMKFGYRLDGIQDYIYLR